MNHHTENSRVRLLNLALTVSFSVCFCYAVVNIPESLSLTVYLGVSSVLSLIIWIYFQKSGNLKFTTYAAIGLITCTLLVYFFITRHANYSLIWLTVLPLFVYFLLDARKVRIFLGIYGVCLVFFLAYLFLQYGPSSFSIKSIINIIGALSSLVVLISYYQRCMDEAASILLGKNQQLAQVNDALV